LLRQVGCENMATEIAGKGVHQGQGSELPVPTDGTEVLLLVGEWPLLRGQRRGFRGWLRGELRGQHGYRVASLDRINRLSIALCRANVSLFCILAVGHPAKLRVAIVGNRESGVSRSRGSAWER
jgi:hypothetical protein